MKDRCEETSQRQTCEPVFIKYVIVVWGYKDGKLEDCPLKPGLGAGREGSGSRLAIRTFLIGKGYIYEGQNILKY